MEKLRAAVCAQARTRHPALIHACLRQLARDGLLQIQLRPAVQVVPLGECALKFRGHFGTHFETARADTRTDDGQHIARDGSELRAHTPHRGRGQFQPHAPPSAMNGRHGAPPFVGEEYGQAIGGPDANPEPGTAGHQGIAFAEPRAGRLGAHNARAVHLNKIGAGLRRQPTFAAPRAEAMLQPLQPLPFHAPEHAGLV